MEFDDVHGHLFCDADRQELDALIEIKVLVGFDVEVMMESTRVLA